MKTNIFGVGFWKENSELFEDEDIDSPSTSPSLFILGYHKKDTTNRCRFYLTLGYWKVEDKAGEMIAQHLRSPAVLPEAKFDSQQP